MTGRVVSIDGPSSIIIESSNAKRISPGFWLSYGDTICRLWVITMFTIVWRRCRLNLVLLNVIIVIVFWIRTICVNHVCCSNDSMNHWWNQSVVHQTTLYLSWHSHIMYFIILTGFVPQHRWNSHFDRIIHVACNFCTVRPNLHPPDLWSSLLECIPSRRPRQCFVSTGQNPGESR